MRGVELEPRLVNAHLWELIKHVAEEEYVYYSAWAYNSYVFYDMAKEWVNICNECERVEHTPVGIERKILGI